MFEIDRCRKAHARRRDFRWRASHTRNDLTCATTLVRGEVLRMRMPYRRARPQRGVRQCRRWTPCQGGHNRPVIRAVRKNSFCCNCNLVALRAETIVQFFLMHLHLRPSSACSMLRSPVGSCICRRTQACERTWAPGTWMSGHGSGCGFLSSI